MRRIAIIVGLCASLVLSAIALGAAPINGATYKGHTKQGLKIKFQVESTGDYIEHLHYDLIENCSNGTQNTNAFTSGFGTSYQIADSGKFHGTQKLVASKTVKSGKVTLKGKFVTSHKATGTLKDTVTFRKSDPNHRGTCSGKTKFTVKSK